VCMPSASGSPAMAAWRPDVSLELRLAPRQLPMAASVGREPLDALPHAPKGPSSQQGLSPSGVIACLAELGQRELLAHLVITHLVVAAQMTVHLIRRYFGSG